MYRERMIIRGERLNSCYVSTYDVYKLFHIWTLLLDVVNIVLEI